MEIFVTFYELTRDLPKVIRIAVKYLKLLGDNERMRHMEEDYKKIIKYLKSRRELYKRAKKLLQRYQSKVGTTSTPMQFRRDTDLLRHSRPSNRDATYTIIP